MTWGDVFSLLIDFLASMIAPCWIWLWAKGIHVYGTNEQLVYEIFQGLDSCFMKFLQVYLYNEIFWEI